MSGQIHKLTPKQLTYALARLEGMDQCAAFKQASPNTRLNNRSLRVQASRMESHHKIREYIAAGVAERRLMVLLTRDKKRQILGGIAQDRRAPHAARIQAVQVDNRMTGDDAPIRIEGEITLHAVLSALGVGYALPMGDAETLELDLQPNLGTSQPDRMPALPVPLPLQAISPNGEADAPP